MKKLLIICKSLDGGTGTFTLNFFKKKLFNKKISINICSLEEPNLRILKKNQDKIIFFSKKNSYPDQYQFSLFFLLKFIKEFFLLNVIYYRFRPDIIITIDTHCLILAQIVRSIFFFHKTKFIATIHNNIGAVINYKAPKLLAKSIKKVIQLSLNKSDKIVCISKDMSNYLLRYFNLNKKSLVIYYGLSKSFAVKPKSLKKNTIKTIVTISRLFPQKDVFTLVEAFKLVKKRLGFIKLFVIGDGPQRNRLERFVKRLELRDIKFFNWINNPIKILKQSDIFVLSSNWEGLPYVLLEAMSQGLPVISTDTPFGPREILDNGKYGILVPMKDPKAMAKAMYELLTDEKKYNYYARKSLERVKYFSLDKMLNAYKKVILEVINKP